MASENNYQQVIVVESKTKLELVRANCSPSFYEEFAKPQSLIRQSACFWVTADPELTFLYYRYLTVF